VIPWDSNLLIQQFSPKRIDVLIVPGSQNCDVVAAQMLPNATASVLKFGLSGVFPAIPQMIQRPPLQINFDRFRPLRGQILSISLY